tara:strand:- start:3663 stop:4847 length:1185 start_codon:yes stop_codon:yes gene_type:complete
MTTIFRSDVYPTFGHEAECANGGVSRNWSPSRWQDELNDAGYHWVNAIHDGTCEVDVEFIIPPFPLCDAAKSDIAELFAWIESKGAIVGRHKLGGHVHMGNRLVHTNISKSDFWYSSKAEYVNNSRYYQPLSSMTAPLPLALVKDVICRYAEHRQDIDSILPQSRRNGRNTMIQNIDHVAPNGRDYSAFMQAENATRMSNILGGKFRVVNLETWSRLNTIEFRQHQSTLDVQKLFGWCRLIANMFQHSDWHRMDYNAPSSIIVDTPENPFRRGSRIGVLYTAMRVDGGATTRDLMNATGWSADTIRARVSEIRNRDDIGQGGVLCHTQQAYGNSYGASNGEHDLNGYEVVRTIETQVAGGVGLMPENRRGMTSIWAGLSDELFEYFNDRREQLR